MQATRRTRDKIPFEPTFSNQNHHSNEKKYLLTGEQFRIGNIENGPPTMVNDGDKRERFQKMHAETGDDDGFRTGWRRKLNVTQNKGKCTTQIYQTVKN